MTNRRQRLKRLQAILEELLGTEVGSPEPDEMTDAERTAIIRDIVEGIRRQWNRARKASPVPRGDWPTRADLHLMRNDNLPAVYGHPPGLYIDRLTAFGICDKREWELFELLQLAAGRRAASVRGLGTEESDGGGRKT